MYAAKIVLFLLKTGNWPEAEKLEVGFCSAHVPYQPVDFGLRALCLNFQYQLWGIPLLAILFPTVGTPQTNTMLTLEKLETKGKSAVLADYCSNTGNGTGKCSDIGFRGR